MKKAVKYISFTRLTRPYHGGIDLSVEEPDMIPPFTLEPPVYAL